MARARSAPRGSIDVQLMGDSEGVEMMISRLDFLFGPVGMSFFLAGQVTPYLKGRAKNRFANEGDEVSGPWASLSPVTAHIRSSLGYPPEHPINRRSGALERWVTESAPLVIYTPILSELTYPGNPPTGKLHEKVTTAQTGQVKKGSPTVPRPVLGIDATDYIAILGMLTLSVETVGRTGRF